MDVIMSDGTRANRRILCRDFQRARAERQIREHHGNVEIQTFAYLDRVALFWYVEPR